MNAASVIASTIRKLALTMVFALARLSENAPPTSWLVHARMRTVAMQRIADLLGFVNLWLHKTIENGSVP
jgi:hypothetical protein